MRYEIEGESLLNLPHLQDVLDQLLLVVQGVLEAEEDAADHPDDHHNADDYERGRHSQEYQCDVFVPEREYLRI